MRGMTSDPTNTTLLDIRHLKCPLAVLTARRLMRRLPAGTVVRLISDDRASLAGLQQLLHNDAYRLMKFEDMNHQFALTISREDDDHPRI